MNESKLGLADSSIHGESSNWFRSIPRIIRKFLSKHSKSKSFETFEYNSPFDHVDEGLHVFREVEGSVNDAAMIRATRQMAKYGWFWGPMSRQSAQQKLHGMPNGSFLVRNSQINLNNFTISFRTAGKTLHYRIELVNGYWHTFSSRHISIVDLINDAMKKSKENVFCYVKQSSQLIPPFPVRLTIPISHFEKTLQQMCRDVIRKCVDDDDQINCLPLPKKLISFCKESEPIYSESNISVKICKSRTNEYTFRN